jgi:hypothetical protein
MRFSLHRFVADVEYLLMAWFHGQVALKRVMYLVYLKHRTPR